MDTRVRWSEEEDNFLKENYPSKGVKWCAEKLNRKEGAIANRAKRLRIKSDLASVQGYDEQSLKEAVEKSNSYVNVCERLGKTPSGATYNIIRRRIKKFGIDTSHFQSWKNNRASNISRPIEYYLKNGSNINSSNLKDKLYKEGLKERECETTGCGQGEEWMGKKISLILDHINGDSKDNRLENLRIVCPNCNAALPTHCRGKKAFSNEKTKTQIERQLKMEESERQRKKNGGFTDAEIESSKKQRRVERPPLDILLKEIDELGYVGTGRKYGVSDNAIRNWKKTMV